VKNKLPNIEFSAISRLLAYKNNHLATIDQEVAKLALYKPKETITDVDIEKYVISDIETNIFRLLDALLALNHRLALSEFQMLLETNSVF
jgi:DNA polymerase III delta subunit